MEAATDHGAGSEILGVRQRGNREGGGSGVRVCHTSIVILASSRVNTYRHISRRIPENPGNLIPGCQMERRRTGRGGSGEDTEQLSIGGTMEDESRGGRIGNVKGAHANVSA